MYVEDGDRFVAFFDVLGFSSWVEAEGSKEVFTYLRGFMNLMVRSSLPGSIVNPDMSVDLTDSDIGYVNFSDSIIFYSRDDSYDCLKTMLEVCGDFMNVVICGPSRMLRGAIAHGEFCADPTDNAFVGKALIDAYRLESAQDWLACSLHPSVEALPAFARILEEWPDYIVPSLAPLKQSSVKPYCINWAYKRNLGASFNVRRSLLTCYQRGRQTLVGNPIERRKLRARIQLTRDFLTHYGVYR